MARKPVALKKRYAIVTIWRRGAGFGSREVSDDVFETVNWFHTKDSAVDHYKTDPQGQTTTDGECNRILLRVIATLRE